jgi:hypothetical protein
MKISDEGIAITKRFFEAIEMLALQKKIRGLQTFTREYNINYWNMHTLKNDPHIRVLKPELLYYLAHDFGISTDWLILGKGAMFSKNIVKNLSQGKNEPTITD